MNQTLDITPTPNTPTAPSDPVHEQLLTLFIALDGDFNRFVREAGLSPTRLLAFCDDPFVRRVLEAREQMQQRHHRELGRQRQAQAAEQLAKHMADAPPADARRAAATLARLASHMVNTSLPPRPAAPARAPKAPATDSPNHNADYRQPAATPHRAPDISARVIVEPKPAPGSRGKRGTRAGSTLPAP